MFVTNTDSRHNIKVDSQSFDEDLAANHVKLWIMKGCFCEYRASYPPPLVANAWRQMYAENKIAEFLKKNPNRYDFVVVSGPDFFYWSEFSKSDIRKILEDADNIMMSSSNNGEGYTNGFYVGRTNTVVKILERFEKYENYCRKIHARDYEFMVKVVVDENSIKHNYMKSPNGNNFIFCKIRANLEVFSFNDNMKSCIGEINRIKSTLMN
jgi:hypothetical protein